MSLYTPRIDTSGDVFVSDADADEALDYYVRRLGFEKRSDFVDASHVRRIEVALPGAASTISLAVDERAAALAA